MAAKLPPARNVNFKTLQIKVTKNHVTSRFVVFSRHETKVKIKVTQFICFSILVLCMVYFLVTHNEARACTIAHRKSRTNKSPNTARTLVALQYLKHMSTLKQNKSEGNISDKRRNILLYYTHITFIL